MTEEKIQLQHPEGKHMPRIVKEKYYKIKKVMIRVLKNNELTHTQLFNELKKQLDGKFDGSISWYGESVKLDLEAKGEIKRTDKKPQTYLLT